VSRDFVEWSQLTGAPAHSPLDGLFSDLIGTDRDRLTRVFTEYATHDAAAALRLADESGLDLVREQPRLVLQNCTNPPFLGLAVQKGLEESGPDRRWAVLLAEAALRHRYVARSLRERPASIALSAAAREVRGGVPWYELFLVRTDSTVTNAGGDTELGMDRGGRLQQTSCLGAFLSLAGAAARDEALPHEYLDALSAIRRPPATLLSYVLVGLGWLGGALGVALYVAFLYRVTSPEPLGLVTTVAILFRLMPLAVIVPPLVSYRVVNRRLYAAAANVATLWLGVARARVPRRARLMMVYAYGGPVARVLHGKTWRVAHELENMRERPLDLVAGSQAQVGGHTTISTG
jgi:hypothetical protein